MDRNLMLPVKTFIIHLKNIYTGEIQDVRVKTALDLPNTAELLKELFEKDDLRVENITEIPSIIKIDIEPICPN